MTIKCLSFIFFFFGYLVNVLFNLCVDLINYLFSVVVFFLFVYSSSRTKFHGGLLHGLLHRKVF